MFKYKIVNSLDEIHLREDLPTFADIETDGLYINTRLIQLYQPDTSDMIYIIDTDIIDLDKAKNFIKPLWLVFHNASYDLGTLNIIPAKLDDTFYLIKTAKPEFKEFSLDKVVIKLGLTSLYKEFDKKTIQKSGFIKGAYLSNKQLKYSATDVYALSKIWDLNTVQAVREHNLAYKVDILALREVIMWQQNGLPIIKDTYHKYMAQADKDIKATMSILPVGLNPRSPKQVKDILRTTSSDKPTLTRLYINDNIKLAGDILKARKALNDKSKLSKYNFDRIVGRFNPAGAVTGRWTCKGGDLPNGNNLQNYPRQFKGIFGIVPESNMTLITADYSTAELRAAASIYRDANMYKALKNGYDLHKYTAAMIYNIDISNVQGRQRSNAKVANFGFAFGLSAKTFIQYAFDLYNLKFTLEEAQELKNKWMLAYPAVAKYHKMCWNSMNKSNYVCETALGRRIAPKLGTDAINAPVQGTIAETMKLGIHYIVKENPEALKYIVNSVHDSLYMIVPEKDSLYWGELLARGMKKGWTEICKRPLMYYKDIPMPVDVAYGKNMTDLSEDFEGGGQALSIEEMEALNKKDTKC